MELSEPISSKNNGRTINYAVKCITKLPLQNEYVLARVQKDFLLSMHCTFVHLQRFGHRNEICLSTKCFMVSHCLFS